MKHSQKLQQATTRVHQVHISPTRNPNPSSMGADRRQATTLTGCAAWAGGGAAAPSVGWLLPRGATADSDSEALTIGWALATARLLGAWRRGLRMEAPRPPCQRRNIPCQRQIEMTQQLSINADLGPWSVAGAEDYAGEGEGWERVKGEEGSHGVSNTEHQTWPQQPCRLFSTAPRSSSF